MQVQENEEHDADFVWTEYNIFTKPGPQPFSSAITTNITKLYTFQRMKFILTKIISQSFNINLV